MNEQTFQSVDSIGLQLSVEIKISQNQLRKVTEAQDSLNVSLHINKKRTKCLELNQFIRCKNIIELPCFQIKCNPTRLHSLVRYKLINKTERRRYSSNKLYIRRSIIIMPLTIKIKYFLALRPCVMHLNLLNRCRNVDFLI